MTRIHSGRHINLRYSLSGPRSVTLSRNHGRRYARARELRKIRSDEREARRRPRRTLGERSQKVRRHADARSRCEHWIKASVAARRVHLSLVYETVNQDDDATARGGSVNRDSTISYRPASRFFKPRQKFRQKISVGHASRVTSRLRTQIKEKN